MNSSTCLAVAVAIILNIHAVDHHVFGLYLGNNITNKYVQCTVTQVYIKIFETNMPGFFWFFCCYLQFINFHLDIHRHINSHNLSRNIHKNSLRNIVDSTSLQKRKYTNLLFKNISPQVHRLSNIFISEFL